MSSHERLLREQDAFHIACANRVLYECGVEIHVQQNDEFRLRSSCVRDARKYRAMKKVAPIRQIFTELCEAWFRKAQNQFSPLERAFRAPMEFDCVALRTSPASGQPRARLQRAARSATIQHETRKRERPHETQIESGCSGDCGGQSFRFLRPRQRPTPPAKKHAQQKAKTPPPPSVAGTD